MILFVQERFQRNVWDNVSVSVGRGQMNSGASMLSWNVSAPCRLEAQVWLCQRGAAAGECREQNNSRQNLVDGPWRENRTGFWVTRQCLIGLCFRRSISHLLTDLFSSVGYCMLISRGVIWQWVYCLFFITAGAGSVWRRGAQCGPVYDGTVILLVLSGTVAHFKKLFEIIK